MLLKTILNGLYFSGLSSACAPMTQGICSILMLHHVRAVSSADFAPNAHLSVTPEFLDATIMRLKQSGYRFISMDEVQDLVTGHSEHRTEPAIAITLDDGYRDNLQNAVPVFKRHEVPFTIYVAPGLVDATHTLWWEDLENIIASRKKIVVNLPRGPKTYQTESLDEKNAAFSELLNLLTTQASEEEQREIVKSLSEDFAYDPLVHVKNEIMSWNELKKLSKEPLCTMGAHTIGHFALARLEAHEAAREIAESREILRETFNQPIAHFAYPYGYPAAAGMREFDLIKNAGFETAVTTRHGVVYQEHAEHMTALPRISVNGTYQSMRYIRALLSGLPTRLSNKGKKLNVA
ncbi:MAG: polysaccharide deacetylase family protein [Pseudomonadota bacterium]